VSRLSGVIGEMDAHGVHVDDAGVGTGRLYGASGDSSTVQASVDDQGMVLSCVSFVFDRVAQVSAEAGRDMTGADVEPAWTAWLRGMATTRHVAADVMPHVLVADCDRVAVDVGVRLGGAGSETSSAEAGRPRGDRRGGFYTDITGPHPASFRRRLIVTERGSVGLADVPRLE